MGIRTFARRLVLPLAAVAALALLGCDGGGDDEVDIGVVLDEYTITPQTTTSSEGSIRFVVQNSGTVTHEFLVIDTDLAPGALPTNPDGSYDENAGATVVVDEIEDVAPGATETLHVDLAPGHYVLICNMVVGATSHYAAGMRVAFTVT